MFTDIFIKRPVLALSISLLILLFGIHGLLTLQVRQYPQLTTPVVTVTSSFYGASPEIVQSMVTQQLTQAIMQANGVDYVTSSSVTGTSTITAYMKLNFNSGSAVANVLAQVQSVKYTLPSDVLDPSIAISTGAVVQPLYIGFTSKSLTPSNITDYILRVIQPQLQGISGVSTVMLIGEAQYAMRLWLDPQKMAALGVTAVNVNDVLSSENIIVGLGQADGFYVQYVGNGNTSVNTVQDMENIVIRTESDGNLIRVKDIVQEVNLSQAHKTNLAIAGDESAVIVALQPTPSANVLSIAKEFYAMQKSLEDNLPNAIKMQVLYDSTKAISQSIWEVGETFLEAVLIVLVVIFLFVGKLRAVLIPIITIPLSIIGVAMLMQMFGFTINLLTLLAMVLAIGLVVDDAIVVLENIERHIELGETPFRAAIIGAREIATPVIAMTLTLVAVYAPVALTGGITGVLFQEFALTLAGSVFISGVIALTLSPMMCSKLLKEKGKKGKLEEKLNVGFDKLKSGYSSILSLVLTTRVPIVILCIIIFLGIPFVYSTLQKQMAPIEDIGVVLIQSNAPASTNLDYQLHYLKQFNKEGQKQFKNAITTTLGISGVPQSNQGLAILNLKPWGERPPQQVMADQFKSLTDKAAGVSATPFNLPQLPSNASGLPFQMVIKSPNTHEDMEKVKDKIMKRISDEGKFLFIMTDLLFHSGNIQFNIDREKAKTYGVSINDIAKTLSVMMSDGFVNFIDLKGRSYQVIPQVKRILRMEPEAIKNYYVTSSTGMAVSLYNLINFKVNAVPLAVNTFQQMNSITFSGVPLMSQGAAMNYMQAMFDDMVEKQEIPKGYLLDWNGESRQLAVEGDSLVFTFIMALFVIFFVLSIQFESYRDALVILFTVPLAISGALIVLSLLADPLDQTFLYTLNIYTEMGLITLVGLISKHGILICEVAKQNQLKEGMNKLDAVMHAAQLRLRPVLMTTMAMVAGLIPLLYASGAGAAQRYDIGLVIVAGLSIGTLFTLLVLPVIYTFLAANHKPEQEFEEEPVEKPIEAQ